MVETLPAAIVVKAGAPVPTFLLAVEMINDQLYTIRKFRLERQVQAVPMTLFRFIECGHTMRHGVIKIVGGGRTNSPVGMVVVVPTQVPAVFGGVIPAVEVTGQVLLGGYRTDQKANVVICPTNQTTNRGIGLLADRALVDLCRTRESPTVIQIKRAAGFQIHSAGNTQGAQGRKRGFVDIGAGEQLGGQVTKVGAGGIDGGGTQKGFAVERGGDIGQAANLDWTTFTGGALYLNTGNPLEGVGDGDIRQLADVFGGNGIDDRGRIAFGVHRVELGGVHAGDHNFFQHGLILRLHQCGCDQQ